MRRLSDLRRRRSSSKFSKSLARLREAAEGEENLLPRIKEAVRFRATLGEISQELREVFGEYRAPTL